MEKISIVSHVLYNSYVMYKKYVNVSRKNDKRKGIIVAINRKIYGGSY